MVAQPASKQGGSQADVPEVVVIRLPQYIRALATLVDRGVEMVSSQQLGEALQVTPAQIRKDLSYFGRFGKQGRGYVVTHLLSRLKEAVGLDRQWNVGLVGVGRLGGAILSYPGFAPEGFHIVAAFDANSNVIGTTIGNLNVQSLDELQETINERKINMGIVAVPGRYAQGVTDKLVDCGIKAVLNYSPVILLAPPEVKIRNIDPVHSLQTMTFYLLED